MGSRILGASARHWFSSHKNRSMPFDRIGRLTALWAGFGPAGEGFHGLRLRCDVFVPRGLAWAIFSDSAKII
jgi:hypothetical protein